MRQQKKRKAIYILTVIMLLLLTAPAYADPTDPLTIVNNLSASQYKHQFRHHI